MADSYGNTFTVNGVQLPKTPDAGTLSVEVADVDSTQTTEAGTVWRDVTRRGRHTVSADFTLTASQLQTLAGIVLADGTLTLSLWLPDKGALTDISCWLSSGFNPKQVHGHGGDGHGLWQVSLTFTEY